MSRFEAVTLEQLADDLREQFFLRYGDEELAEVLTTAVINTWLNNGYILQGRESDEGA